MKKFFRILLWSLVGVLFIGTFVYLFIKSQPTETRYELVSPTMSDIERTTILTGTIEPRDEIEIKPQVSGIISEINVEAGDMVKEGDVVARIKIIPDEGQLSSALSRIETAKINLEDARVKHERNTLLLEKKVISREEYEATATTLALSKAELDAARDAYSIVKEGVSRTNAKESNTLVRATITGLVLDVPVKVGSSVIQANTMNDGTTVATVADMNNLIFKGKVDETEVGQLSVNQPMEISIGALPDLSLDAVIENIAPKGTETNGANTFEIKAAINVPEGRQLRAGYSANASVMLNSARGVLTVPESVIEWAGDKTYVYVLTDSVKEQKFDRTEVATGISDGINIEVKSGVDKTARLRGAVINEKARKASENQNK
ncbi:efflux RND transporter periplasmic adaptor subunit [Duncaniella muricolitica]|jgi:HlyD family secretion protein|uniref:efflux RND transporter periplasmic adaptor subunit n=1 Tax=Duncaniella muricolitica TaxID=2880704 RepID=UPI00244E182B|nr:efflux RND transporter periplasmic adaptor subunit [Duncaniella muricolitica]